MVKRVIRQMWADRVFVLVVGKGPDMLKMLKFPFTAALHKRVGNELNELQARDALGATALCIAAEGGHVEIARSLLLRADMEAANNDGEWPLLIAAFQGFVSFMNLLLRAGANKDATDNEGQTALMAVAARGNLRGIRCLLQACAQVNYVNRAKRSALYFAAELGHFQAMQELLEAHAHPDQQDKHGCTPLLMSAQIGNSSAVGVLLRARANTELRSDMGRSPLLTASQCGHLAVVQQLLHQQALLDGSSLRMAVRHGQEDVVQCLLGTGALTKFGSLGELLALSARHHNSKILHLLLGARAEPKDYGEALCVACEHGNLEAVQYLMAGNMNHRNAAQSCPMLIAAERGDLRLMRLLLESGASPDARDAYGFTAIYIATQLGHAEMVQCLLEFSADSRAANVFGRSPMQLAAESESLEILSLLRKDDHSSQENRKTGKKVRYLRSGHTLQWVVAYIIRTCCRLTWGFFLWKQYCFYL